MLKRYKKRHPFLYLYERDTDVDRNLPANTPSDDARRFPVVKYIPTSEEHCTVIDLLDEMDILELATKRLQKEDLTLVVARDILGDVLVDFPELSSQLNIDADIVESTAFETGVVKIMQGLESDLTATDRNAVSHLLRFPDRVDPPTSNKRKSYRRQRAHSGSNSAPKRPRIKDSAAPVDSEPKSRRTLSEVKDAIIARAKTREENKSKYIDLSWLPATSVEVERLFSSMKCMLGCLRKSMSAETLETVVFLHMTWDLVTNEVTTLCVQKAREEDLNDEDKPDSVD